MNPYKLAEEFVLLTDRSIFLTGKAGTGKTTFLKQICRVSQKQTAVVAPTGVAAINAGGTTIHSFFQLPYTPFVPTLEGKKNLIAKNKMTGIRRKVMQELELLIIDEVSMVRADMLDAIDTLLRHYRFQPSLPFGGVQVLLIGDMYQLSPVAKYEEWHLLSEYYQSPYFFHSKVILEQPPVHVELDQIFRQTNTDFIMLLNQVRNDSLTEEGFALLRSRFIPDFKPRKKEFYITLTTHNANADTMNAAELVKIKHPTYYYEAMVKGDFPEKSYPNDFTLELKVGARVMFISNDNAQPRRYYNGKIGAITELTTEEIFVKCDGEEDEISVVRETWENIRYTVNKETNQIEEEKLGSYTQYPLRLAWAITIHKSQGLTFDRAIIDAGAAFAPGQVYVALSRCRSLEGMVLLSPIVRRSLLVDGDVLNYASQKPKDRELIEQLEKFKHQYSLQLVMRLFDFKPFIGEILLTLNMVRDSEMSFSDGAVPYCAELQMKLEKLDDVGLKFQRQLHQIATVEDDTLRLSERLKAAAPYFDKEIKEIQKHLAQSRVSSTNYELSVEYTNTVKSMYSHLALKRYLINEAASDFSVQHMLASKLNFTYPQLSLRGYESRQEKRIKASVSKDPTKSQIMTLDSFRKLKDLEAVGRDRGITVKSVETHLRLFIERGELDVSELVSREALMEISDLIYDKCSVGEIVERSGNNYHSSLVRLVSIWLKKEEII